MRQLITFFIICGTVVGLLVLANIITDRPTTLTPTTTVTVGTFLSDVVFSPDGQLVAVGDEIDGTIHVWRVADRQHVYALAGHQDGIYALAFSPDGRFLASGSYDQTVRLWNTHDGSERQVLNDPPIRIDADGNIAFSADGARVVAAGTDGIVAVWRVADGVRESQVHNPTWAGQGIEATFDPTDQVRVVTVGTDVIRLWRVMGNEALLQMELEDFTGGGVTLRADGAMLAVENITQPTRIWSLDEQRLVDTLASPRSWVYATAFSKTGDHVATAGGRPASVDTLLPFNDTNIYVWHLPAQRPTHRLIGHTERVSSVAFNPDGSLLASVGDDGTLRLWSLK